MLAASFSCFVFYALPFPHYSYFSPPAPTLYSTSPTSSSFLWDPKVLTALTNEHSFHLGCYSVKNGGYVEVFRRILMFLINSALCGSCYQITRRHVLENNNLSPIFSFLVCQMPRRVFICPGTNSIKYRSDLPLSLNL